MSRRGCPGNSGVARLEQVPKSVSLEVTWYSWEGGMKGRVLGLAGEGREERWPQRWARVTACPTTRFHLAEWRGGTSHTA